MSRLTRWVLLLALCLGASSSDVHSQNGDPAIFIDVDPLSTGADADYNVRVTVSPRSGSDAGPVSIDLPWYVESSPIQCIGCGSGALRLFPTGIGESSPEPSVYVFSVTVVDDSYAAFSIIVQTGASRETVFVPLEQSDDRYREAIGEVQIVALNATSEPDVQFIIDVDVALPLSGGFLAVVPSGLDVDDDTSCVDRETRTRTDFNRMCTIRTLDQPNGDTWVQAGLPSGEFSLRIILTPDPDFEHDSIELSAGGRYFETEIISLDVPGDFEQPSEE